MSFIRVSLHVHGGGFGRPNTRALVTSCAVLVSLFATLASSLVGGIAAAEEPRRTIDVGRAFDAGVAGSTAQQADLSRSPPDPPPIMARERWIYDLRWDSGDVWLLGVRREDLQNQQATPRAMGRFMIELYEGPTVIERVRFDFPLLGAQEPDAGVSLSRKLRTSTGVYMPVTSRGNRLELVDRATLRRWALPWPPRGPDDGGAEVGQRATGARTN